MAGLLWDKKEKGTDGTADKQKGILWASKTESTGKERDGRTRFTPDEIKKFSAPAEGNMPQQRRDSATATPTSASGNENLAMLNRVDFAAQKPVAQNKTWFENAIDKIGGAASNVPIVKIIADAVNETGAAKSLTPEQRTANESAYRKNITPATLNSTADYLKDSLNRLSQSAAAGLASGANSIEEFAHTAHSLQQKYNPVDVVWNKLFPGDAQAKASTEEKTHKYFSDTFGSTQKYYKEKANTGADKVQQFTNQGVEYVSAMLPQLILSIATGGGSAEANAVSGIANATKSIIPGLSKGSLSSFGQKLLEMTPFMTQAAGGYILDAENKNPNLSLEQKMSYGIAGGLSEGITEMLPIGTLKVALGIGENAAKSAVKKGVVNVVNKFGKKGLAWVNNAGANIIQEVAVNPLTNMAEKVFVDPSKPVFGKGGIIDAQQASESTVGALAMSAVLAALGLPANMASHIMASKFVENNRVPTQKDIESILNTIKEDTKSGGIKQQTQEETDTKETAPSPFVNNAMDRLNAKGQEVVSAAKKMPDLNLSQTDAKRYEVYREFAEENLPGASREDVDGILKDLRQTEIDAPPARGDMPKRLNYFIEKHKRDNPESTAQPKPVNQQQASKKPENSNIPINPKPIESVSADPIRPLGKGWEADRGSIPGEPIMTYKDKGAIIENTDDNGDVLYEAMTNEGQSLGIFQTVEEAGKAVESHVDGLDETISETQSNDGQVNIEPTLQGAQVQDGLQPTDGQVKTNEPVSTKEAAAIERFANNMVNHLEKNGNKYTPEQRAKTIEIYREYGERFLDDIKNKNFKKLTDRLHRGNPSSLKMFTEVTGLSTKTDRETREGIRSLDPEAYDKWANEKKAASEKREADKQNEALLKSLETKVKHNGVVMTKKEFIDSIIADGYTVKSEYKRGIVPVVRLSKGSTGYEFTDKNEKTYINKVLSEIQAKEDAKDQAEYDALSQEEKDAIEGLFQKQPTESNKQDFESGQNKQPTPASDKQDRKVGDKLTVKDLFGKPKQKIEIISDNKSTWEIKLENGKTVQIGKKALDGMIVAGGEKSQPVGDSAAEIERLKKIKEKAASNGANDELLGEMQKGIDKLESQTTGKASLESTNKKEDSFVPEKSEKKSSDVGYHAGDLGKAEYFKSFYGSNRDTGHFGTGTYFVGNKQKLDLGSYKDRPLHEVDLSAYNLFKPKSAKEAGLLHDMLKYVNNYYDLSKKNPLDYDEMRELKGMEPDDIYEALKKYDAFDEDSFKAGAGESIQEVIKNKLWNSDIADELHSQISRFEQQNRRISYAQDYKETFENNIESVLGINKDKAEGVLQGISNKMKGLLKGTDFYSLGDIGKEDSLSTQFMKALGYEGIDVRHIPQYDNTSYGTVVYDLKKEPKENNETKPENSGTINIGNKEAAQIAEKVVKLLEEDEPFTFAELTKIADEAYGGTQGQGAYTSKDAYDSMELGINLYILKHLSNTTKANADVAIRNVKVYRELLALVPTQTKGNTEQQQYQQFSTPPNIAYVAAWLANINNKDTMLEPSAGIGGLALFAKASGAKVIVNEYSERRLEILKNMPFDGFYNENAEHINDILGSKVKPTVVVMNPPFSATAGRMGDKNSTANAKMHMEQALEILQDGGRLVAIVGQGMSDKASAFSDWWKEIKGKYNVRANIGLYTPSESSSIQHSNEYKKYGTDFGVQILIIDKTGPTTDTVTATEPNLEEVINLLEGIRNDRTTIKTDAKDKPDAGGSSVQEGAGENGTNAGTKQPIPSAASNVGAGQRNGQQGQTGNRPASEGQLGKDGTRTGARTGESDGGRNNAERDVGENSNADSADASRQSTGAVNGNGSSIEKIETENISKEEQINKVNEDAVYSEYSPQKLKIPGSQPHPAPLVQSTAMASVSPPDITYSPSIQKEIITSGKESIAQMEAITYAGQANEKMLPDGKRRGFFIGDGTGVGKGRTIAGIIMDNYNQGRKKAVWISKNNKLLSDSIEYWEAIGGKPGEVFTAAANKPIDRKTGILYMTYFTLPQGQKPNKKTGKTAELSRLDQVINWLGKDFDGAIVFDEAHMMQNLLGSKPAEIAKSGALLQERLPNARIVYASATGATEVENFAYATRLGIWGQGTSFSDVDDFVGKVKAGGLAAMELVARDLKAMGSYIARNISFMGVKYDTKLHNLTDVQTEIYDTMAEGWQIVLQNINAFMVKTGANKNSQAKKYIMQNFWSTQQRFFNQVLTAMQMPTVIEDMKRRLAAGESCVLQLVNTNAAAEEREVSRIEEEGGSLDDMDITPKGAFLEMIDKCFPTQKFEEYIDDNGKKSSRPVVDRQGNPVEDSEAVKAKENLMKRIDQMQIPNGPMDIVFTEFGVENVTEVTGRPRRFVYKRNKFGDLERQEESRTEKVVAADVSDFLNDKKQILIFSDAGGTGKSYHAGKEFKNQRQRVHYLIQAGWNASKAVQGFGRTHRTNQASAPEYVLVTTNLKGQKRFISSIARRLDQLGALTKGQRDTGSSGLFNAKDNLESKEARDALEMFYRQLVNGQIPSLAAKPLLKKMGLIDKIIVKEALTSDVNELRDVTRFLNRILVLKSEEQNQVFDEFIHRLDYVVEEAIRNDRLDVGLENYKSAGAKVTEEKSIHKDQSGAETKYIAITAKQKAIYWEYKEILANDNFTGFYKNKETGEIRAALRTADKTNRDGSISRVYYMQSPTAGKRSQIVENSLKEKWDKVDKKDEKIIWNKELRNEPEYREEKLHLISGALLPIWNRLPDDHARVIRITTDDGNSYLGRLVPTHQIDETLRSLGVSREKETFDVKESINKVIKDNMLIRLVDKTTISRSKVAGEYRLEIEGNNIWSLRRNYSGIFDEKIGSKWRYFIPNNEKGIEIIEKITESAPILEVVANKKEESEVNAFTSNSSAAQMPQGDGSSESSKTVDDLIAIIEKHTGVPIRTGKFRQRAEGIFKVKPEVIRTKVRGDMPVISHEFGHYLDKKFGFSNTGTFDNELLTLGQNTSKQSYSKTQIRQEGIAEFVRLYLTNPADASRKAPQFMAHFEKTLGAEELKFLSMLRREITAIVNLPNNKKIWNDVSYRESRKSNDKAVGFMKWFYDAWVNESGEFVRLQKFAEGKGWIGENIDILTQTHKGFEAKAKYMLFDKQRDLDGNIVGDSMTEILNLISNKEVKKRKGDPIQERKDFITYMISRRAMDYKDRGLVMPHPWYVYEDNIQDMENKYPHFTEVFNGLRKWEDNNLQLLVDSGIKTEDEIETVKYMNANHVPLYRIREAAEAIRAGGGNTLGQSKEVIKRARGSGATIIDPLESMITDSFIIRRAAESNSIMRVLYTMYKEVDGIGSMVEEVAPGLRKTSFTVEEIRRQMLKVADAEIQAIKKLPVTPESKKELARAEAYKKSIEDMSDIEMESVVSIYRPLYKERDNEVTVYIDGNKKLLQVDKELYKAIKGLNREQMNIVMRALNMVKKVKQAGIVTSVPFVLRNIARDTGTSLIQSEAGINPADILQGYWSAIKKDKWFKEWVAAGGATDYVNVNNRRQAQKLEDDLFATGPIEGIAYKSAMFMDALKEMKKNNNERTQGILLNAAKNMVDIPFDMIRDAVDVSEAGSRIAEFRKAVESGVDKKTAAAWSRKLSVDFLRHGYTGKQVNAIVAFFNANLQGIVRMGETFKAHPIRTMARGFVYITLPTMLLYFINHDDEDYQNLPEWRRAMFWNIPYGNGKFVMLPKPPGYGWIFGALPEFTMNKILKDDPRAWNDIKNTFVQSFQLPTEVSAASPAIDVWANKSWTGAPIENTADKKLPSYLRRNDNTSMLANLFGDIVKNSKGLSPKQIDYLVKQYTGSVGDFFWRAPDAIKGGIENPSDVTRYPVIKSFIVDAAYSSASIDNLYNYGEELEMRRVELMETKTYPAMKHLPIQRQAELFDMLEAARSEYNKLADDFADARKAIKEIKASKDTPGVKEQKIRQIRITMNKMAAGFNKAYEKFKKDNDIK